MADPERGDHRIEGDAALGLRCEPPPEQEILPDAQMRKELGILEHEPDPAAMLGHEGSGFGVHQNAAVKHDAAPVGMGKAGDEIDDRRFARARTAEQGSDADFVLEGNIEIEGAELLGDVNADHMLLRPLSLPPVRHSRALHPKRSPQPCNAFSTGPSALPFSVRKYS